MIDPAGVGWMFTILVRLLEYRTYMYGAFKLVFQWVVFGADFYYQMVLQTQPGV